MAVNDVEIGGAAGTAVEVDMGAWAQSHAAREEYCNFYI
jgi:hypothetical protein